jgi:hypothetical protein
MLPAPLSLFWMMTTNGNAFILIGPDDLPAREPSPHEQGRERVYGMRDNVIATVGNL